MALIYWVFDPASCQFPKPRVSILPSRLDYSASPTEDPSLSKNQLRHFSRGRYALGEAYRLAGLDHRSTLLAPAYHCVTMLDPALALGAKVLLYSLNSDLLPDSATLDQLYAHSTKPIKALLATHFFGFVRDFSWLKQWCDEKGVVFIEDCSHVLFNGRFQANGAGVYGDYVTSSPYKFFPCADGGLLYAREGASLDRLPTKSATFVNELRSIKSLLEKSWGPRISISEISKIDQQLKKVSIQTFKLGHDLRLERSGQSLQYSPAIERTASLLTSRWVASHSSVRKLVTRRQKNYRRWVLALSNVPNCKVMYPELPGDVVPYMFPLYLDAPMPHFYWLKQLGVPVWRWDEMAVSNCPVASDYRLHLIHLPCHQALSEEEMVWMLTTVKKTLTFTTSGVK